MPMPIIHPMPEVIGEVPGDMFDNVLAASQAYFDDHGPPSTLGFDGKLTDLEYELHDALLPLIRLITERETTRIVRLGTSVSFCALSETPSRTVDYFHKDNWRLDRTAHYVVAKSLGTEFKVPTWCKQGIVDDGPPSSPGFEVVDRKGLHNIIRPRPLTVVRFKRHKHRAPLDPTRTVGRRPWVRMGVYDYVD